MRRTLDNKSFQGQIICHIYKIQQKSEETIVMKKGSDQDSGPHPKTHYPRESKTQS